MDVFQQAADDNDLSMIITTGAVYGIFLVFGNSWSEFLRISILTLAPSHDDEIFAALIYALSATFICITSLIFVVHVNKCMRRNVNGRNLRRISTRVRTLSMRSRKDIANGKGLTPRSSGVPSS